MKEFARAEISSRSQRFAKFIPLVKEPQRREIWYSWGHLAYRNRLRLVVKLILTSNWIISGEQVKTNF